MMMLEQSKKLEIKKPCKKQQNFKKQEEEEDSTDIFLDETVIDQQLKALAESKEDEQDLLIKFRQKYPKSQAFAPEDEIQLNKVDHALAERTLEFELEKCLKVKEDLIAKRLTKLTKPGVTASFSKIMRNEGENIGAARQKRDKELAEIMQVPQLKFLPNLPELYKKQVVILHV